MLDFDVVTNEKEPLDKGSINVTKELRSDKGVKEPMNHCNSHLQSRNMRFRSICHGGGCYNQMDAVIIQVKCIETAKIEKCCGKNHHDELFKDQVL